MIGLHADIAPILRHRGAWISIAAKAIMTLVPSPGRITKPTAEAKMDTGTIYRGQKMPDALRPQTAVRGVLHLSQLGGKNWFAVPVPALIAGPEVRCWRCHGVVRVGAEPDSEMSAALTEMAELLELANDPRLASH